MVVFVSTYIFTEKIKKKISKTKAINKLDLIVKKLDALDLGLVVEKIDDLTKQMTDDNSGLGLQIEEMADDITGVQGK